MALISKKGNENIFKSATQYYVDSSENHEGNFDNYLYSAMIFLTVLPEFDWSKEIEKKKIELQGPKLKKRTLVLDLDETLLHADLEFIYRDYDAVIRLKNSDGTLTIIPLILRPGLQKFLEFASQNFEVIVFTSSCREYAEVVLNFIDSENIYFDYRIYRENCLCINPQIYIKDISIIKNRRLEDIIIVDNSIIAFAHQLDNGILVPSFICDREDNILEHLAEFLQSNFLNSDEDVTQINRRIFGYQELKNKLASVHKINSIT